MKRSSSRQYLEQCKAVTPSPRDLVRYRIIDEERAQVLEQLSRKQTKRPKLNRS